MFVVGSFLTFPFLLSALASDTSTPTPCRDDGNYANASLRHIPRHQEGCHPVVMTLTGNSIVTIPSGAFEGYNELEVVNVSYNQLKTVKKGAFDGAVSLKTLDLSHNNIPYLNQSFQTFSATSIDDVNLAHNQIQSLDSNAFSGNTIMKSIDLSFNHICDISDTTFYRSPDLRMLNLAHNKIETLDESFFASNTELRRINLSYNRLCFLPPSIFQNLNFLFEVKLSHNPLSSIEFVFTSPSIFIDADNCGQPQIPEVQFDSGGHVIEMNFRVECNCYNLTVEATRTPGCIDKVTDDYTNAACFNKEITTVANIAYSENTQLTESIQSTENIKSTESIEVTEVIQSTESIKSTAGINDKGAQSEAHQPASLLSLLLIPVASAVIESM